MAAVRARARYRFDNTLARGTAGVVLWLAVVTFLFIVLMALLLALTAVSTDEGRQVGFGEAVWLSFTRALDPGTMAEDTTWPFRLVSALVTLGGVFVLTSLIGLVSSGIDRKLDDLRKGRSPVLESGHTLVLGWSPKLFPIVSELVIANANQPDACVAVMSRHDKVGMDDAIRERVPDTRGTRVVCRTGDPSDPTDLALVSPREAKSVIVLCPEDGAGDAQVVRTVLALRTVAGLDGANVVAELADPAHARALREVTEGRVLTVVPSEVIARITAQVCLQPGLSDAYQEFLDFSGHEIYFTAEASLVGHTFGEALLAYERCAVIGLRFADGRVELDPPAQTVIAEGDMVIVVAEDDDAVSAGSPEQRPWTPQPAPTTELRSPERFVVVGWNPMGRLLLRELGQHVAPGSSAVVLVDRGSVSDDDRPTGPGPGPLSVTWQEADTTASECLAAVLGDGRVDHVIILCRRDMSVAESDARSLMTLLQVRQLLRALPERPSVVTELLDVRDLELARTGEGADDFVVSEHLSSLMMVQLSENRELAAVFDDLFDGEGTDLCLKPADAYGSPDGPAPFAEAVRAARDKGEAAIGYRSAGKVVLNPAKSRPVRLGRNDHLVVLAPAEVGRRPVAHR